MSLLPHDASFHEQVQDLFAAFRGRGVSLSPLDVELLDQWASTGAPFEVVARGIRKAAEGVLFDAPEDGRGLRSLVACKRKVEVELKKFTRIAVGRAAKSKSPGATVSVHLDRHKKLLRTLKRVAKSYPTLAPVISRFIAACHPP